MKKIAFLFSFSLIFCAFQCNEPFYIDNVPKNVNMKPVYATSDVFDIKSTATTTAEKPRQIFTQGSRIYVVDEGKGFLVYDNTNRSQPALLGYVQVYGITNVSMKQGVLYANNLTDLVAIDVSNVSQAKETQRLKNAFPSFLKNTFPAKFHGYFECVDTTKGIVVRWDSATVKNPECRR